MKGTLILLAAGIVNRILGFIPRIALPRVIGAEGVGLYQMGYPFLIVIITIITGGIPLALSKLIAEAEAQGNESRIQRLLWSSLAITGTLGVFLTVISISAASWITQHLFTDDRVYYTFLWMSPIIILVSISSVFRGYFQGRQNMIPTAVSQVCETLMRIFFVLFFAYMMLPRGVEYAAAGAMAGVLVGEIGGLLVIMFYYWRNRKGYKIFTKVAIGSMSALKSNKNIIKRIFRISLPVTASRLVGSLSYFLESIVIVQSLAIAGVATITATAQYGMLQGMIIPIILLPSALTFSLSVSLIPSLSEAAARKDMKTIHKRLQQSLRLALVTGAPFAVIMYVLADPICHYLFNIPDLNIMLKMMAPIALFIYFQAPLQAALQALDKPGSALVNTFIGAAIKLLLIYWLASKPSFGILGAIMAINVNIIVVTILHWFSVSRLLKFSMDSVDFFKVGASMLIMGAACYMCMNTNWTDSYIWRFIASSLLGILVYLICVAVLKLVDKYDLRRIPFIGNKIQ
ncbi:stage V sporulation protein B [Paenibacillus psychroresistens]|uniref:Stage V sporulation protein B n=1 Tax=Paenibacillus psychroresistens TaxID=1778678 RepID=A0A6B8RU22_9BACL|nr:stage V sporulation protein B [Paenibacillus psychroresistens]QGR00041.1 stage V sporulation protein B [Paenibacillus psychroresistens]